MKGGTIQVWAPGDEPPGADIKGGGGKGGEECEARSRAPATGCKSCAIVLITRGGVAAGSWGDQGAGLNPMPWPAWQQAPHYSAL